MVGSMVEVLLENGLNEGILIDDHVDGKYIFLDLMSKEKKPVMINVHQIKRVLTYTNYHRDIIDLLQRIEKRMSHQSAK